MFQPSQVPLGPFAQLGQGLAGAGQQMAQWTPVITNMIQMKQREDELKRTEAQQDFSNVAVMLQWTTDPQAREDMLKAFHSKHPDFYLPTVPPGAPAAAADTTQAAAPPGPISAFTFGRPEAPGGGPAPSTTAAQGPISTMPFGRPEGPQAALPPTSPAAAPAPAAAAAAPLAGGQGSPFGAAAPPPTAAPAATGPTYPATTTPPAAGPVANLPVGQRPGDIMLPPTPYGSQSVGEAYKNDQAYLDQIKAAMGPRGLTMTVDEFQKDPIGAALTGQHSYQVVSGVTGGGMPKTLGEYATMYGIPLRKGVDPSKLTMRMPMTKDYWPDTAAATKQLKDLGYVDELPKGLDLQKQFHTAMTTYVGQINALDREIQTAGRDNYHAVAGLVARRNTLIERARQDLTQQAGGLKDGGITVDTGLFDTAAIPYSEQDIKDITYGGQQKEGRATEAAMIARIRLGLAENADARAGTALGLRQTEVQMQIVKFNERITPAAASAMKQAQTDLNHAAPGSAAAQNAAAVLTGLRMQNGVGLTDAKGNFHVLPAVADPAGTAQSQATKLENTIIPSLERKREGALAAVNGFQRQLQDAQKTPLTQAEGGDVAQAARIQRIQNALLGAQQQFSATSAELTTARTQLKAVNAAPTTPAAQPQPKPTPTQQPPGAGTRPAGVGSTPVAAGTVPRPAAQMRGQYATAPNGQRFWSDGTNWYPAR